MKVSLSVDMKGQLTRKQDTQVTLYNQVTQDSSISAAGDLWRRLQPAAGNTGVIHALVGRVSNKYLVVSSPGEEEQAINCALMGRHPALSPHAQRLPPPPPPLPPSVPPSLSTLVDFFFYIYTFFCGEFCVLFGRSESWKQ